MSQLPRAHEKVQAVPAMFDCIAPRYDVVNRGMIFGMDVGSRSRTIDMFALEMRSLVLDVACGAGDLCCEMHRRQWSPRSC